MPTRNAPTPPHPQAPTGFDDTDASTGHDGTHSWFGSPWLDEPSGTASPPPSTGATTPYFFRVYRAFLTARATLALMLLVLLAALWAMGTRSPPWVLAMALGAADLALAGGRATGV